MLACTASKLSSNFPCTAYSRLFASRCSSGGGVGRGCGKCPSSGSNVPNPAPDNDPAIDIPDGNGRINYKERREFDSPFKELPDKRAKKSIGTPHNLWWHSQIGSERALFQIEECVSPGSDLATHMRILGWATPFGLCTTVLRMDMTQGGA